MAYQQSLHTSLLHSRVGTLCLFHMVRIYLDSLSYLLDLGRIILVVILMEVPTRELG